MKSLHVTGLGNGLDNIARRLVRFALTPGLALVFKFVADSYELNGEHASYVYGPLNHWAA